MLADEKLFNEVEKELQEQGKIQAFEKENGPVIRRMMITETAIPDNLNVQEKSPDIHAFKATFDFYDMEIGIALDVKKLEVKTGIWMTPQVADAQEPSDQWIQFFMEKLASAYDHKTFSMPVYSLISDQADMTIIPNQPDA